MKFFQRMLLVFVLFCTAALSFAQERGTKDEAVAMMNAAMDHVKKVGVNKALDDFTNDKGSWTKKDLYVSSVDWKGNSTAHGFNPKQVGRNLWELKDPNGVLLIQEIVKVAQSQKEGWVAYQWPDPLTKKLQDKLSLVRPIPGTELCLIVGIYK
jgi:cytochrome c